ncbi:MAG: arylsulfatase [Planctomycetes bacterium]|nr:arylsulfatase [Planctomycetota bacterium]
MRTTVLLLLLFAGVNCAQESRLQPNIVLVLADDLGSAEFSCTGSKVLQTPHIDALRKNGIMFTQAYSGAPVCAPSRCVLLTGRDSLHAQIRDNHEVRNPSAGLYGGQRALKTGTTTLASLLHAEGYATGCFGKWGLGGSVEEHASGHPLRQGFERFYGYLCQRNAHSYWPAYLDSDATREAFPDNKRSSGTTWAPERITEEALIWMEHVKAKPFFLYFPSILPHLALQAPLDAMASVPPIENDTPYDGKKGYEACERPRATYTAMVQRLDAHVGQLVNKVRSLGLLERTIFIVLSDNGATWELGGYDPVWFRGNGELRGHKGQVYEGGIRVPFIASWAGRTKAGASCALPVAHQDLLPTLCALAGVKSPPTSEGVNLAEWICGKEGPTTRAPLCWEFPQGNGAQAVRMGNWKGVRRNGKKNSAARMELYDLATDPAEANDIAAAHSDIVKAMLALLAQRTLTEFAEWEFPESTTR